MAFAEFFLPKLKVPPSRPNRNSASRRFNGSLLGKTSSETEVEAFPVVALGVATEEEAETVDATVEAMERELLVAGSKLIELLVVVIKLLLELATEELPDRF